MAGARADRALAAGLVVVDPEVALVAARSQNEQAQKQLSDLQRLGKEQALKSAQGQKLSADNEWC